MPQFSISAWVLAIGLVGYLITVGPVLGKRQYESLRARRDHDPGALNRLAGRWIAELWAMAALVLAAMALSPGVRPADLGLAAGDLGRAGMLLAGIAAGVLISALALRRAAKSGQQLPGQAAFEAMLPRTRSERWTMAGLSVTAGIAEELVFRGFLIALGIGLGLPAPVAAAAALAIFVAGHYYQGLRGMAVVALAGFGLTALYFYTGSLLVPIVLHCAIDLRSFLLTPAPRPAGTVL